MSKIKSFCTKRIETIGVLAIAGIVGGCMMLAAHSSARPVVEKREAQAEVITSIADNLADAYIVDMTDRYLQGVDNAPVILVDAGVDEGEKWWLTCSRKEEGMQFAELSSETPAGALRTEASRRRFSGDVLAEADATCVRATEMHIWKSTKAGRP